MGRRHDLRNRITYTNPALRVMAAPLVAASSNWWEVSGETCVIAYQPKGAASQSASYSNLANPGTYDAAAGTAPGWDSTNGWQFDRTSSEYLTTGFTASSGGTYTLIARFTGRDTSINADQCLVGFHEWNDSRLYLEIETTSFNRLLGQYGTGSALSITTATSGVLAVTPSAVYVDGSSIGSITGSLVYDSGRAITIGALNHQFDGISSFATVNVLALALYSTELDSTQISSLTSAMNAL